MIWRLTSKGTVGIVKSHGEIFQMSTMSSELYLGEEEELQRSKEIFHHPPPFSTNGYKVCSLNHVALCLHKAFLSFPGLILTSKLPVDSCGRLPSCTHQVIIWQIAKDKKQRGTMNNEVAAT